MANNHVIDPTYFYQCIEIFSFDYHLYRVKNEEQNEFYEQVHTYEHEVIRGSLQSQGSKVIKDVAGNRTEVRYDFYCKSLYRINKFDLIHYKNMILQVEEVRDYDEYGVRSCSLVMVQLTQFRDLEDYIKYIEGVETV